MSETIDTLTMARKLGRAVAGGDKAVLTPDEASALHDMIAPAVEALIEHERRDGTTADTMPKNQRTLMLAVAMLETIRERYDLPDREMDFVLSVALMVFFKAEAGDREAWRIINEGLGKLAGVVSQIAAARAGKTAH